MVLGLLLPALGVLVPPARPSTLLGARSLCPSRWAWGSARPRAPHSREAPLDVGERGVCRRGRAGPGGLCQGAACPAAW